MLDLSAASPLSSIALELVERSRSRNDEVDLPSQAVVSNPGAGASSSRPADPISKVSDNLLDPRKHVRHKYVCTSIDPSYCHRGVVLVNTPRCRCV